MVNKEKLVCLVLRVQEATEDLLVLRVNLANQVHLDPEAHKEKQEILVHLVNREKLVNLATEDQGVQLVNLVILETWDCLEWKENLGLLDLLDHLVHLVIPFLLLLLLFLVGKQSQECLEHLDPWDHLVLLVREEQMEEEDLKEVEECLACLDHLEHLEDKDCLVELVIQENLENLVDQADHTQKMT